ncbi:MAG: outer membrane protein assembly factor BamD [Prevotellaceae bacterium]|jgi:outer membrane protein assembly factor BamD|nr:outer membrane protein assembly factor BamD [Prevotellaceae bacterium]
MRFFKDRFFSTILILTVFAVHGCSGYNKILKNPNAEKRYAAALKYYASKKYARSTPLFESLDLPFNGLPQEDTAKFYAAKGYFLMNDNASAEIGLEQFTRMYGRSPFSEEAYYLRAVNLYQMTVRPELDQSNTMDAITAFRLFRSKYPDSDFGKDKDYLDDLIDKLEKKSYLSAKLYYQIEDYKSAVIALRNSLKDYPDSRYAEELSFLVLKSSYIYAQKSIRRKQAERYISAIDEYYNFVSEYPNSKYKTEAETIYHNSLEYVQKRGINVDDELSK